MRLALTVHRAGRVGLAAAVIAVAGLVFSPVTLALPALLEGLAVPVPVTLFASVLAAPLVATAFPDVVLSVEARARRSLLPVDLAVVGILLGPVAAAAALAAASGGGETAVLLVRDFGCFAGITLCLLAVVRDRTAAGVAVAYLLVVALVGSDGTGRAYPWAWIRADPAVETTPPSLALLLVGVVAMHLRARRRAARLEGSGTVEDG